jgi:hypothetical protein
LKKDAIIDSTGRYRYWLLREWDIGLPKLAFVMLNPSTADAEIDDNTIKRCISFAQRFGFGSLQVVNLFAFRATDPAKLLMNENVCIGEENDDYILDTCDDVDLILAAWGVNGSLKSRNTYVENLICRNGFDLHCLGTTTHGHPRHPLFVKGETKSALYKKRIFEKLLNSNPR